MPVDNTLNNWLIEVTVCLLNGCFCKDTFFVRTSNLKANIYIVPFQFVKNSYFKFLQGSVATLFRWSWKILSHFVANLSKTLHINFYQNRSSIVEVMIKKILACFYASQCSSCISGKDTRKSFWTKNERNRKIRHFGRKTKCAILDECGRKMANWSRKKLSNSFSLIGISIMLLQLGWKNGWLELLGCEWINLFHKMNKCIKLLGLHRDINHWSIPVVNKSIKSIKSAACLCSTCNMLVAQYNISADIKSALNFSMKQVYRFITKCCISLYGLEIGTYLSICKLNTFQ